MGDDVGRGVGVLGEDVRVVDDIDGEDSGGEEVTEGVDTNGTPDGAFGCPRLLVPMGAIDCTVSLSNQPL